DYNQKTQTVKISKVIVHQSPPSSSLSPSLIVTSTQHNSSRIRNIYIKFNDNGLGAKFAVFYRSNQQLLPTTSIC
ncbi:10453_t:CDS:1, partial [Entrophospora sp. SA101]